MDATKPRCHWVGTDPLLIQYHDEEWGIPIYNDKKLFEYLILDCFQAGLSWRTILYKRENFRKAFDNFEPEKIAYYNDKDIERLMADKKIVRNRRKIEAAICNAQKFLSIQCEYGSFNKYIWQFTNYRVLKNPYGNTQETIPSTSKESDAMSKDLKNRGFKFVGSKICYAFMQSIGMVSDHTINCYKYDGK